MNETILNKVLDIIHAATSNSSIDAGTSLFEEAGMDSFTIFNAVLPALMEEFSFDINPMDLVPENFESAAAIAEYVERVTK